MRKYYITYNEKTKINYCFLFALYTIAERDITNRLYNTITYTSLNDLKDKINNKCGYKISTSSISRYIKNEIYLPYFSKSEKENKIILNVDFKKSCAASGNNKFITLTDNEILFMIQQNDNMLCKYYLYLKYYCGYNKSKSTDTTANQILNAIGYSSNCGNNKYSLCKYNSLLLDNGFINIRNYTDNKGYCRNIYEMNI